jgi:hypothetical protein
VKDIVIGDYNKRRLHVRLYVPLCFRSRKGLLSRIHGVIRDMKYRCNWACWIRRHKNLNGRCYCAVGSDAMGRVSIAGFGITFWYSYYPGPVPCPCDSIKLKRFTTPRSIRAGHEG